MLPRPLTRIDLATWEGLNPTPVRYAADDETFEAIDALVTQDANGSAVGGGRVVRVPWLPDEIDLARFIKGGTLWLSTWGGLPPHTMYVAAPDRWAD